MTVKLIPHGLPVNPVGFIATCVTICDFRPNSLPDQVCHMGRKLPLGNLVLLVPEHQHLGANNCHVHIKSTASLISAGQPSSFAGGLGDPMLVRYSFAGSSAFWPCPLQLRQPLRPDHIHIGLYWSRTDLISSTPRYPLFLQTHFYPGREHRTCTC
jgi:hypothetical protein